MNLLQTAHLKRDRISLDDFEELHLTKPEDEKWELIDGMLVRGMIGARVEHHYIVDNIGNALSDHLRRTGLPCRVFRESFFLKRREDDLAALPDIMVHCGKVAPGATSVSDPVVLLEVVSPGSEGKDRVTKRIAYQRLPSLQHYVLVERDRPFVDHYIRTADGWRGEVALEAFDSLLRLAAIGFEISLAEIYRDVLPIATPDPNAPAP
jgi:Uma2 family endonuclease